jgi:hypothetical protein
VLPGRVVERILRALVLAKDWEFLENAASRLGGCPPLSFFYWILDRVKAGSLLLRDIEKGYVFLDTEGTLG